MTLLVAPAQPTDCGSNPVICNPKATGAPNWAPIELTRANLKLSCILKTMFFDVWSVWAQFFIDFSSIFGRFLEHVLDHVPEKRFLKNINKTSIFTRFYQYFQIIQT